MATQLPLQLSARAAMGRDDFFVSPANAAAVALIDQWPNWPSYGAILEGLPGSGKTHLTEVFRERTNATRIEAVELTTESVPDLLAGDALVIENISHSGIDENALFHLMNLARQERRSLLFSTALDPVLIKFELPDLRSRINALPSVRILPPDDELLRAVLAKTFADRQLAINDQILTYMIHRMPRSLEAARNIVEEIDRAALSERAEISKQFIARIMSHMVNPELFDEP